MTTITKALHGHTITIDDEQMRFHVTGPIINDWFASYREAGDAITSAVTKHEAQLRKRIALVVLDEKGNQQTITGVHASHGNILGLPNTGAFGFGSAAYYPNAPWIAELLKRVTQLQSDIKRERDKLESFRMYGSGSDLLGNTHAEKVDGLIAMVAAKTKAATEHGG